MIFDINYYFLGGIKNTSFLPLFRQITLVRGPCNVEKLSRDLKTARDLTAKYRKIVKNTEEGFKTPTLRTQKPLLRIPLSV